MRVRREVRRKEDVSEREHDSTLRQDCKIYKTVPNSADFLFLNPLLEATHCFVDSFGPRISMTS